MPTYRIELTLLCRGCERPQALNGIETVVTCDRCQRSASIPFERWRELLLTLLEVGAAMAINEERDIPLDAPEGLFRRIVRRCDGNKVRCSTCRETVEIPALAYGDRVVLRGRSSDSAVSACENEKAHRVSGVRCRACDHEISIRRIPELPRIVVVGETIQRPQDEEAGREPAAVPCSACGAGLSVDGSTSRMVTCRFCAAQSHLPDAIWMRLHPVRPVVPFYLIEEQQRGAPTSDANKEAPEFAWHQVKDVVADDVGRLYVAGMVEIGKANIGVLNAGTVVSQRVWSLDEHFRLRWIRPLPAARLYLLREGKLVVCEEYGSQTVLSLEDGTVLDDTPIAVFKGALKIVEETDGVLLVSTHAQVYRAQRDGETLANFEEQPSLFKQIIDAFASNPLVGDWGILGAPTSEKGVVVLRNTEGHEGVDLVLFDRFGNEKIKRRVSVSEQSLLRGRIVPAPNEVFLFLDRKNCKLLAFDATANGEERMLLEAAWLDDSVIALTTTQGAGGTDNTSIQILSDHGAARTFSMDGRLLWANEAARRKDRADAMVRPHADVPET